LDGLKELAEYVYEAIFSQEYVYPHILLRDYARGVIEYSLYLKLDFNFDIDKVRPSYKSEWYDTIPTNDEIKQYDLDYKSPEFKDYYWSQNTIISSMQPEYSKICMYGDFGRYVFQSGFTNWDFDVQQLSNLAIKRIFELGYDVEKHGKFDRSIDRGFNYGRAGKKPERIGKKYQWIAFYEIMARVSDNFTMYDNIYVKEKKKMKYEGPWEPYVRDIDPSILIRSKRRDNLQEIDRWWLTVKYDQWSESYEDWVKRTNDLPEPGQIIQVTDCSDKNWLVLMMYPDWEEPVGIGIDKYEHPHKYIWYQIISYIIKEKDCDKIINWGRKKHFMGNWMPRPRDMYQIFSREYYWSPAFRSFQDPYWYGEIWKTITDRKENKEVGKAIVTAEHYLWEEEYDCSKDDVISFYKPDLALFEGLNMRFGLVEGELIKENAECICFDPSVKKGPPGCLLVRKDALISFLEENNLKIFWTVLGGKCVRGCGMSSRYPNERLEFSGIYTLDEEQVNGNITNFKFG
ncbi:MAG: ATP-binding protein, partial [Planctomycetota bacterium]